MTSAAVLAIVASAAIGTGCGAVSNGTDNGGSTATTKVDPNKKVQLAAFLLASANTYSQANLAGMQAAAKAAGNVEVTAFDGEFDGSKQAAQIQDATASGKYNAYVVFPNDGAVVVPPVKQAIAKGIKVAAAYVPIGSDIYQGAPQVPGVLGTVWHDEPYDGRDLGQIAIDACKAKHPTANPCKVAYLSGGNGISFEQAKLKEFKKKIATAPQKITLVAQQEGNFLQADSRKAAQNILQAQPGVNVFATTGDQMTAGVEDAVKSAGLTGKVTLIGDGASTQGVAAVKDGRWFGTTVYLPFTEGKLAAEMAINAVRGIQPAKNDINVRDSSPIGHAFTQQTTTAFTPQWHT